MRLEEIVLDGFKSYAVRTTVSGCDREVNASTGLAALRRASACTSWRRVYSRMLSDKTVFALHFFDQEKKYCLSSSSWSSSWSSSTCSFRCGGADRNMIGFPVFFFTGSIARFRDSATFFSCVTRTVV